METRSKINGSKVCNLFTLLPGTVTLIRRNWVRCQREQGKAPKEGIVGQVSE